LLHCSLAHNRTQRFKGYHPCIDRAILEKEAKLEPRIWPFAVSFRDVCLKITFWNYTVSPLQKGYNQCSFWHIIQSPTYNFYPPWNSCTRLTDAQTPCCLTKVEHTNFPSTPNSGFLSTHTHSKLAGRALQSVFLYTHISYLNCWFVGGTPSTNQLHCRALVWLGKYFYSMICSLHVIYCYMR
jgi:hypothetical protein